MESAAPQTRFRPWKPSERLQPVPGRASGWPAVQGQLGGAIGFFLHSDGNPKLGSLVDAFAEELPVHVGAPKPSLRPARRRRPTVRPPRPWS